MGVFVFVEFQYKSRASKNKQKNNKKIKTYKINRIVIIRYV